MEVPQVQTAGHWLAETIVAGENNALCTLAANPVVLELLPIVIGTECIKASKTMTEEPYDGRLSRTVL